MAPQLSQEKYTEIWGKLIIWLRCSLSGAKAQPAFSSPIEATGRAAMWEAYADPAGSDRATIKGDAVDIWSEHRRMVQGRDHR
ncbi:hypothetical protein [Bradyrhizobium quebecense]|uniref:Uncharacterized protein n=2 Tax=Bradyrhizobium quebecense TaxID=2748629 RepID=A0ABS3M925_9BRAD|nr:hypothetical protein [Bradyrhizobium quebecense]UGY03320.1 hypothetical protein J4P68_0000610 [Bradyrhizobium quebecense]